MTTQGPRVARPVPGTVPAVNHPRLLATPWDRQRYPPPRPGSPLYRHRAAASGRSSHRSKWPQAGQLEPAQGARRRGAGSEQRAAGASFHKPHKCPTRVAGSAFPATSRPGGSPRGPETSPPPSHPAPPLVSGGRSSPASRPWIPAPPPPGNVAAPLRQAQAAEVSSKGQGRRREGRGKRPGHPQKSLRSGRLPAASSWPLPPPGGLLGLAGQWGRGWGHSELDRCFRRADDGPKL